MGFLFALVGSLFFGKAATEFIAAPVEKELGKFYDRRAQRLLDEAREGSNTDTTELNRPTQFHTLTFDRRQLEALFKGRPTAEINDMPHPYTAKEYEDEKKRLGVEQVPNARIIDDADLLKLKARIEQPVEYYADQAKVIREYGRRPALATLSVTEAFMVYFKMSMFLGIIIGSPWIFYQIWSFVAAGLYPSEKRYVHKYLPLSVGLFVGGAAFCEFLVIPVAVRALLSFNEWMNLEPDLRLNEWLHFAILFPLVFGLAFQTPLVMYILYKVGLVEVETFANNRRIAFFGLAVLSMLLTIAPDAFSMLAMMIPLWCLYEFGILMCRMAPRPKFEEDFEDEEAVVGI
jgi:Tat protein translocase TatC